MLQGVSPRPLLLPFVALIVAALAAASFSVRADETGSIAGHVKLTTRVRGTALPSNAYPTRTIQRHDAAPIPEIRNVIVYLKNARFEGPLPAMRAEIHQEHEAFGPHILAVTKGSTVSFPNEDAFYHNVFSLSFAAAFDLGRYPRGDAHSWTFTKTGLVKVYCKIHSHMSATVMVLDHPYFTVPDEDGSFEMPRVPPGDYTIAGWHERVGERTAPIRVHAGRVTSIDLTVPVEDGR